MNSLPSIAAKVLAAIITLFANFSYANIVDYNIASQNLISHGLGPAGGILGTVQGTFTADFNNNTLTYVNMSITLVGDTTYWFTTPIAFGSYTNQAFPGLTYYEANLSTTTPGPLGNSIFYMDFLQENTHQLFAGHTQGVFTSFGTGGIVLNAEPLTNTVPTPSALALFSIAISATILRHRNNRPIVWQAA
jgi:hypothetical protein